MANIKISDLQSSSVARITSEEELLNAVSDSVARAIKARGLLVETNDPTTVGMWPPDDPIAVGNGYGSDYA